MSKKISSKAKIALVLTVLGCVIPTVYINVFSTGYLLYHRWPTDLTAIGGLICIVGVIFGVPGIFERKVNVISRITCIASCIASTFFCLAFLLYVFSQFGAARESPKRIACSSNLKQIHLALQLYAADYAGNYPPENGAAGLEVLRKNDYLTNCAVYHCPSVTMECQDNPTLTEENVDYVYIGGLNIKSDRNLPLMYDKANNHGGYFGNVLFADGTIKAIEGNPWTQNIRK